MKKNILLIFIFVFWIGSFTQASSQPEDEELCKQLHAFIGYGKLKLEWYKNITNFGLQIPGGIDKGFRDTSGVSVYNLNGVNATFYYLRNGEPFIDTSNPAGVIYKEIFDIFVCHERLHQSQGEFRKFDGKTEGEWTKIFYETEEGTQLHKDAKEAIKFLFSNWVSVDEAKAWIVSLDQFKELNDQRCKHCGYDATSVSQCPGGNGMNDLYSYHPDESFSVSSDFPPGVEYYKETPEAVLLLQGASDLAGKLLATIKKSIVSTDINTYFPDLIKHNKVLIIPSGGLVGLDNSQAFKENLAEFVKQGGVLICFSQPNGYEFSALPGGQVVGYGWGEDQACHSNAVYIDTYHQVLAGQSNGNIDFSVDGYLTSYPDSTSVLLRRTKNNQAAMIMYPYGQGYVIATTMYEDWAFGNGQSTAQGRVLVRDIISWAKDPKTLQEIKPGESVNLSFEVKNKTEDKSATQIKVNILDPDRNIISESIQPIVLDSYQTTNISLTHNSLIINPLGIWSVEYSLLDSSGIEFQKESIGERYVISNPPTGTVPSPDLSFSLQMDAETYARGSQAIITTNIWNNTDTDTTIYCSIQGNNPAYPNYIVFAGDVTIPANSLNSFITPYVVGSKGYIWGNFYKSAGGARIGSTYKGQLVTDPSVGTDIITDKNSYNRGETVNYTINIAKQLVYKDFDFSFQINLLDAMNNRVADTTITSNTSQLSRTGQFVIPQEAASGTYILEAIALFNGERMSKDSSLLQVTSFLVSVMPTYPPEFLTNSSNAISYHLENIGQKPITNGQMDLELMNPAGSIIYQETKTFSNFLAANNIDLNFSLPMPESIFGKYKLRYSLTGDGETIYRKDQNETILDNSDIVNISFDKISYRMRDPFNAILKIKNNGKFRQQNLSVNVSISSLGFNQQDNINLGQNEESSLSYNTIVPVTPPSGIHEVIVTLGLGNTFEKRFRFTIPVAKLEFTTDKNEYSVLEDISFQVTNSGGVDINVSGPVKLVDPSSNIVSEISLSGSIPAGEQKNFVLPVSDDCVSGNYRVIAEGIDKNININGVSASMVSQTNKSVYQSGESITANTNISSSGAPVNNAKLNLKVITPESLKYPGTPVQLTYDTTNDINPSTSILSNGQIWAVFERKFNLYLKKQINSVWQSEIQLTSTNNDSHPVVYQDKNNKIWLVYERMSKVYYKTTDNYGTTWTPSVYITPANNNFEPGIKEVQGDILICYCRIINGDFEIAYRKASDNFVSETVIPTIPGEKYSPNLMFDSYDRIWLTFIGPLKDIHYTYSDDLGANWIAPINLTNFPRQAQNLIIEAEDTTNTLTNLVRDAGIVRIANLAAYDSSDTSSLLTDHFDSSTSGAANNLTYTAGMVNYAGNFNGTNAWVDYGVVGATNSVKRCIDVWVKPHAFGTDMPITYMYNGIELRINAQGQPYAIHTYYPGQSVYTLLSPNPIPLNKWSHLATSWGTAAKLYVNGELAANMAIMYYPYYNNSFLVGKDNVGRYFNGEIDELRISRADRAPFNIPKLSGVLESGWKTVNNLTDYTDLIPVQELNEGDIDNKFLIPDRDDSTLSLYHLQDIKDGSGVNMSFDTAISGLGGVFNGTNSYMTVQSPFGKETALIYGCVDTWVKVNSIGRNMVILSMPSGYIPPNHVYYAGGIMLGIDQTGHPYFGVSYTDFRITSPNIIPVGEWVHLTGRWSYSGAYPNNMNEGLKLFINGELVAFLNTWYFSVAGYVGQSLHIGFDGTGNYFDGMIDEVRFSKVARNTFPLPWVYPIFDLISELPSQPNQMKIKSTFTRDDRNFLSPSLDKVNIEYLEGVIKAKDPVIIEEPGGVITLAYTYIDNLNTTLVYQKTYDRGISFQAKKDLITGGTNNHVSMNIDSSGNIHNFWSKYNINNYDLYWEVMPGKILWEMDTTVSIQANLNLNKPVILSGITGKLALVSTLTSQSNQIVSQTKYPFYIFPGKLCLSMNTDKGIYKPGEPVNISGEVSNTDTTDLVGLVLSLKKNGVGFYTETIDLTAGQIYAFQTTTNASSTFILEGSINSVIVSDEIKIASPDLTASVDCPNVVGKDPFGVNILFENKAEIDALVNVNIKLGTTEKNYIAKTVPAKQGLLITDTCQIDNNSQLTVSITGDTTLTMAKNIEMGIKGTVAATVDNIYPEGDVVIPYYVQNTGSLDLALPVTFTLNNGQVVNKNVFAAAHYIADGELLFNLTEGNYNLKVESFLDTTNYSFQVGKYNQLAITANILPITQGVIPVSVEVTNSGYNDFTGSLSLQSSIYTGLQDVSVSRKSTSTYTFSINPNGLSSGQYILNTKLLNAGNTIASDTKNFEIYPTTFEFASIPLSPVYTLGEAVQINFGVKNTGSIEGKAQVKLKVLDIYEDTKDVWLTANEAQTVSFDFTIPDDLEAKEYKAYVYLNGAELEIPFTIQGVNIEVTANLDKEYYKAGETAVLAMNITNQSGFVPQLYAKAKYDNYDSTIEFDMSSGSAGLSFNIPVNQFTGEKIFYGIYTSSGRSIHLNTIYLYQEKDGVNLILDKEVYFPGDLVQVTVNSLQSGDLYISAPDYETTIAITGGANIGFNLPQNMVSGTYAINYSFTYDSSTQQPINSSTYFDVDGISIKILECNLDKSKYSSQDTIKTELIFNSNREVTGLLQSRIFYPDGTDTTVGEIPISLAVGDNKVELVENLNTQASGIHRKIHTIYQDSTGLFLTSGAEAFDVGNMILTGFSADKTSYPTGFETVYVNASFYSQGENTGNFKLSVGGNVLINQPITLNGFYDTVFAIIPANTGSLQLTGELTSGGLISKKEVGFDYGSDLPDLVIDSIKFAMPQNFGSNEAVISVNVKNIGKTNTGNDFIVAIYNGDPDSTGVHLGDINCNALAPDSSSEVTYNLNVSGTNNLELYVVADNGNNVREFLEDNNKANISITIPNPPVINPVQGITRNPIINITGSGPANNMVEIYRNGQMIASVAVDSTGVFGVDITADEGGNTVYGRTLDSYGNTSLFSNEIQFTLDTEPPATPVLFDPEDSSIVYSQIVTITVTAEPSSLVSLKIGENTFTSNAAPSGVCIFENMSLSEGENIIWLWSADLAGNNSPSLQAKIIVKLVDLEVTKGVSINYPRLLVWVEDTNTEQFVQQVLNGASFYYYIVKGNEDLFNEKFRSGKYNLVFLLNSEMVRLKRELKERVFAGEGVIVSSEKTTKAPEMADMLGIKFIGHLPQQDNIVHLLNSPISQDSILQSKGKSQRVELTTGQMAGYVSTAPQGSHNGKITSIRVETEYDFTEDTTWNVTLQVYAGDSTLTGQLLDYETIQFNNLPVGSVDTNAGYNSTNLAINGIDNRIEFVVKNIAVSGSLSGQYTLRAIINKNGVETILGPSSFNVNKCLSPVSGAVYGPFKITVVDKVGVCCVGTQEPAIILNNYGEGKATAFAFDLVSSNNDTTFSKIKELILNSINYTTPEMDPIYPMVSLPIGIDIQNKGKGVDLMVREMVPSDLIISDIFNGGIRQNNEITWQFNMPENTTKDLKYYLSIPDNTLQYSLFTEVNYLDYDSTWKFYNNYPLDIVNAHTMEELIQEIIDELNGMALSPQDREKANAVLVKIQAVRLRNVNTKKDLEKNIEDMLKATDKLAEITVNTTSIRLKLGELLKINEVKWSRN